MAIVAGSTIMPRLSDAGTSVSEATVIVVVLVEGSYVGVISIV